VPISPDKAEATFRLARLVLRRSLILFAMKLEKPPTSPPATAPDISF
jgi:hypothetical protein